MESFASSRDEMEEGFYGDRVCDAAGIYVC